MGAESAPVVAFDVNEGKLVIGAAAFEDAIESGIEPSNFIGMAQLLSQKERIVGPSYTEPIEHADWDPALDIPLITWLDGIIKSAHPGEKSAVNEEAVIRAGFCGILPRITYFRKRPGGLQGLYADAELRDVKMQGCFDNWSKQDYVGYLQKLSRELGRKPNVRDIRVYSHIAGNPSEYNIGIACGSPGNAMELAGWVNVRKWNTNDFIDWGVRFMFVNNGIVPSTPHLIYVGANKRGIGPSDTAIIRHDGFTGIMDFQTQVMEEYTSQRLARETTDKMLIEQAELEAQYKPAVSALFMKNTDPDKRLQAYARLIVVENLLPGITLKDLVTICGYKRPSYFAEKIIELNPTVTLADLETLAVSKGVYHLLWPHDNANDPLNITNWDDEWHTPTGVKEELSYRGRPTIKRHEETL